MIELVDLVDSQGKIKEIGIPRDRVDRFSNLHMQIVICVIFDNQGRMLVHQRALTKRVNPGDIDHVCGGVISGETPIEAAIRESFEETGVKAVNLEIVTQGINKYNRFRYLMVGETQDTPQVISPEEVEWIDFHHINYLQKKENTNEFTFVDEFFEDSYLAQKHFNKN